MSGDKIAEGDHLAAIMTLTEIASYLKVSEKTIIRMVRSGKLPGAKVASQWRFVRAVIDDWLNARMYALPDKELLQVMATTDRPSPLAELIAPETVLLNLQPGAKDVVLAQLVEPLREANIVGDADVFLARLMKRESLLSTAIGHGLAVPHVRTPENTTVKCPRILLGICRAGTDFGALDGGKTYVFAVPCIDSEAGHLRLMAQVALIFRQPGIIETMRNAGSKEDVVKILSDVDAGVHRAV